MKLIKQKETVLKIMKLWIKQNKDLLIMFSLFALSFTLRSLLLINTDDSHGIAAGRALIADCFLKNPLDWKILFNPVHPPLHLLSLVCGLRIYDDPLLVPRVISLLWGSLFVFPFFYFVKESFNRRIAAFSGIAVALYSEHIVYSIIGTSETMFNFLLFSGLALYCLFKKKSSIKMLFFSAVCIGLSCLCRYEGILFIPIIAFFLRDKPKDLGLFLFISIIPVGVWSFINLNISGNPITFLSTNDITVPLQYNWLRSGGLDISLIYKLLFWPRCLIDTMGILMFVFGIAGVCLCVCVRKKVFPSVLFLLLFLIFVIRTVQEQLYLQPRYSIILGLMLIPFSLFAFFAGVRYLKQEKLVILVWILLGAMIAPIGERVLAEPLYVPEFVKDIGKYVGDNFSGNGHILVDHCGDENFREPIKLWSKINPCYFIIPPYEYASDGSRVVVDSRRFFEVLHDYRVSMLVYSSGGGLGRLLNFEKDKKNYLKEGFLFKLDFARGPYDVYTVKEVSDNDQDM
ncbi:MAG: glycosyltransferase family 39 protein [Candidatus Omnitrophota bacterium]